MDNSSDINGTLNLFFSMFNTLYEIFLVINSTQISREMALRNIQLSLQTLNNRYTVYNNSIENGWEKVFLNLLHWFFFKMTTRVLNEL